MLKRIAGATALGLLAASPLPALAADVMAPEPPAFSASLEGWGGAHLLGGPSGNIDPDDTAFFAAGIDARLRMDIGSAIAIQLDASGDRAFGGEDSNDTYEKSGIGGIHLSTYNDAYLLGVFGGYGRVVVDDEKANVGVVGVEGQMYFDQTTLYLQAGYMDAVEINGTKDDPFHNAFFVRGVSRYFLSEQTRLQGELSAAFGKQDSNDRNMMALGWGLRADHQYTESLSVFAGYKGAYYDNGSGSDSGHFTEHLMNVGVTLRLNQPTLLAADRHGPTLDLPSVTHWAGGGQSID
ncbi:MAG: hypothetical protein JNM45_11280 [Rhizobiales bacterium]|nr:hypothetical protein [Hyphomicrobiales bacterium]